LEFINQIIEFVLHIVDFVVHIDVHLNEVILTYGAWTYAILFFVIFSETGFVVTPFLPGDSLLFAAGAFAASGSLSSPWLILVLSVAAIVGNIVNYWIGYLVGPGVFQKKVRFLNKEYLERTHRFYEKHGGKTIVIARFIPIIRTFAPFVAGVGYMTYGRFMLYNVVAGIGWVVFFVLGGFYFGNIPVVKNNFGLVVVAIIIMSTLPAAIEFLRHRHSRSRRPQV
jgi:membrane-associated protein